MKTPVALANASPGLERKRQPWDLKQRLEPTLKALGLCEGNPFRVQRIGVALTPRLSLRSNPGLTLANAFGVRTIGNAFGVETIGNAFGVKTIANAFGVETTANAFGVKTRANAFGVETRANACGVKGI